MTTATALGPLQRTRFYLHFLIASFLYLPQLALARLVGRADTTHRKAGQVLRRFGRFVCRGNPRWHFQLEGDAPADIQTAPYVVVSNHRSAADPFLLANFRWDMRWVVKRELFRVPLIGTLISLGGDIPVDRASKADAAKLLKECEKTLRSGQSVMIFPEGTRNPEEVGDFKSGAFRLAIRLGVPILPIAIEGTPSWLDPKYRLGGGDAKATILPPISTKGISVRDAESLGNEVRAAIVRALETALPSAQPTPEEGGARVA